MSIRNIYTDDGYRNKKGIKVSNLIKQFLGGTFGKDARTAQHGKSKPHQGWDLYAEPGTEAKAISDGTVVLATSCPDFGRSVMLQFDWHGSELVPKGTLYAFYAHLREYCSKNGDQVKEGDVIAKTGVDGNAKGASAFAFWNLKIESANSRSHSLDRARRDSRLHIPEYGSVIHAKASPQVRWGSNGLRSIFPFPS
jgi:hypothetical protein